MRPRNAARDAEIVRRANAGELASAIAAGVGMSKRGVVFVLRRSGIKPQRVGRPKELPPMSTREEWEYVKLRSLLGPKAAREEMFRGVSDQALLTNPQHVNNAWEKMIRDGKRKAE